LPPRQRRRIDGVELAFHDAGAGAPLVLLHGLGASALSWAPIFRGLALDRRVIVVDLPAHGESAAPAEGFSLAGAGRAVAGLLAELDAADAVWVGHSMGGQIALVHALEAGPPPGLVLVAPAGFEAFTVPEASMLRAAVTPDFVRLQSVQNFEVGLRLGFHKWVDDAEGILGARARLAAQPDRIEGFVEAFVAGVGAMLDAPVKGRLGEIPCPTLVVFGEHDRLIPNPQLHGALSTRAVAEEGVRRMANAELVMVDAGHLPHFETPQAVSGAMAPFLARLGR
ncbi:MAG: alpha/beta fold hydrolase, partial [Myxococcota bacterium]